MKTFFRFMLVAGLLCFALFAGLAFPLELQAQIPSGEYPGISGWSGYGWTCYCIHRPFTCGCYFQF